MTALSGVEAGSDQRLAMLRRAALSSPETAVAEWRAWNASADPWQHDPGSRWWFPLIWWNLRDQSLEAEARRVLRQDYSASWLRHQHHAPHVAALLADLHRLGIGTMLLKGAALALTAYHKPALRPFGDIDILVRPAEAERARREVERLGWVPIRRLPSSLLSIVPSMGYVDERGIDIDVHWHALAECTATHADDGFWDRSVPVHVDETLTRALSPSDQLLHVCIHGLCFTWIRTDHWIADAVTILRRFGTAFDWDACLAEARRRSVTRQLQGALERVRLEDVLVVPETVMGALRRAGGKWWEPIEYRAKRGTSHTAFVVQSWCAEARTKAMGQQGTVLRGVIERLQAVASTENRSQMVRREMLRLVGRPRTTLHRFVAYDRRIHVESDLDARSIRAGLEARLPAFQRTRARTVPDRVYQLLYAAGSGSPTPTYRVLVNRGPLAATRTLDEAFDLLVGDLQAFLAAAAAGRTFVHAGAVELKGRVVVLPGASGSGKSTLVAALLRAGALYLSDEFAILDNDARVHPYSRPLRLRGGDGSETRVPAKGLGARAAKRAAPVDLILFANFVPNQRLHFARLSAGHALVRLLNHCLGAQARPEATIATLRTLVTTAPAWAVDRNETDGVVTALIEGALT